MHLRRLVVAAPVEAAVFSLVSIFRGHFGERLEAGGWLFLPFLIALSGNGLLIFRLLEDLQRAVKVFLFLRREFIATPGLFVQLLDALAIDRILTVRDATDGDTQDHQATDKGENPPRSMLHSCFHDVSSLILSSRPALFQCGGRGSARC